MVFFVDFAWPLQKNLTWTFQAGSQMSYGQVRGVVFILVLFHLQIFGWGFLDISGIFTEISLRYHWDITEISPRYHWDIAEILQFRTWIFCVPNIPILLLPGPEIAFLFQEYPDVLWKVVATRLIELLSPTASKCSMLGILPCGNLTWQLAMDIYTWFT